MFIFGLNRTDYVAQALDDVAVQLTVAATALQTCVQIIENRQMLVLDWLIMQIYCPKNEWDNSKIY